MLETQYLVLDLASLLYQHFLGTLNKTVDFI